MKILFVLPRMVSGGVERVTLNLIEEFIAAGNQCALALGKSRGELLEEARRLVSVHELAPKGLQQFVPRLTRLIKQWQPTHVVTAFADVATMVWTAMRLAGSHARWVHGVHNTHASVIARGGVWGRQRYWVENRLAAFVYRHADWMVAVSDGVRSEVLEWFDADPRRVVTIYNPVVPNEQLREVREPRHSEDQPFIIAAMGRLTRQKGFDFLIQAMAQVPMRWRLDIWGEGPDRPSLEVSIAAHCMHSTVALRGYTADPYGVLRAADLFVLPSRHEGLPTVLIEALACQCQIVATDCPHGPREILQGGKFGKLVPPEDVPSMSQAIGSALAGQFRIDPRVLLQAAEQFTKHSAAARWLRVLETA